MEQKCLCPTPHPVGPPAILAIAEMINPMPAASIPPHVLTVSLRFAALGLFLKAQELTEPVQGSPEVQKEIVLRDSPQSLGMEVAPVLQHYLWAALETTKLNPHPQKKCGTKQTMKRTLVYSTKSETRR